MRKSGVRGLWSVVLGLAVACGSSGTGTPGVTPIDAVETQVPDPGGDPGTEGTSDPGPDGTPACRAGEPCDDGDPCTAGERCDATGACTGGTAHPCDDGRECTTDACDGKGGCVFAVAAGRCLIDGICRAAGDADPDAACRTCDPAASATGWSPAADGIACDPAPVLGPCEDAPGGACSGGACVPSLVVARVCDDGDPCTADACDAAAGCTHAALSGTACVVSAGCGTCGAAGCVVPSGPACDDGNPCTADTCGPAGCAHEALDGVPCATGSACVIEGMCAAGACAGLDLNCDDGNVCTVDGCHPVTGCWHDVTTNECCDAGVSKCDDGNVCTNDDCEPGTLACLNTPNTASCNDHDPCTVNDSCAEGACKGVPRNCSDGNPCTADSCDGGTCLHAPLDGTACDDGLACSTGDHCVAGQCVADLTDCGCKPVFQGASKVVTLSIASTGKAGEGLNLDGLPTCQPAEPAGSCSDGVDNALGPIAGLPIANDSLKKALDEGSIVLLFEHRDLKTDGTPYTLAFYTGALDPANAGCAVQADACVYRVDKATLDADCNPLVSLDNAAIVDGRLVAGGPKYVFPFDLPLAGLALHVDLYAARVEAQVTVAGGKVTSMTGILGGAVPKAQLVTAIQNLPDDSLPAGLDKGLILTMLESLVVPDIDGDGDGKLESASLGIRFSAIAGVISGTK